MEIKYKRPMSNQHDVEKEWQRTLTFPDLRLNYTATTRCCISIKIDKYIKEIKIVYKQKYNSIRNSYHL